METCGDAELLPRFAAAGMATPLTASGAQVVVIVIVIVIGFVIVTIMSIVVVLIVDCH